MAKKTYISAQYPYLAIGTAGHPGIDGVIKFNKGIFETEDEGVQKLIENSRSWQEGYIREYVDEHVPPPLPSKTDVVRMTKAMLLEFVEAYEIEVPEDAKRPELVTAVNEFIQQTEEIAADLE